MVVLAAIVVATATQVSPVAISWTTLLGALASIVTIVGAVLWLWKQTKEQRVRNERFDRDWYGEEKRPGVPERPGVMAQLQSLRENQAVVMDDVAAIKVEVFPNHGGSIKDMVTSTDLRLATVELDVRGLHDRLDATTTTTTVTTVTAPDVHA